MQQLPSHIVAHIFQYVDNETMLSSALMHTCKLFYTTLFDGEQQLWSQYPVVLCAGPHPTIIPKSLCKVVKHVLVYGNEGLVVKNLQAYLRDEKIHIVNSLKHMVNVEYLTISKIPECVDLLATIGNNLVKIKELHIIDCMTTTNVVNLVGMLKNMNDEARKSLQVLKLQNGIITNYCVHFIAQQLVPGRFPALHTVILDQVVYETVLCQIRKHVCRFEPRYPSSSYNLFFIKNRQTEQAKNPNLSFIQLSRHMAEAWKPLTDEEKQPYVAMAAEAKQEYDKQKQEFTALCSTCPWIEAFKFRNPNITTVIIIDKPLSVYADDADDYPD